MAKNQRHKAGFTLLEIMLVILLVGLLSSLGVHNLVQWQWRTQYLTKLNEIATAIQQAQRFAQRSHHDYWLSVEPTCIWLHSSSQGQCSHHGVVFGAQGIAWQAQFTQGHQLRFMAGRGLSGFGAGRIRVTHPSFSHHEAAVIVSSLGRVRVCESKPLLKGVAPC